MSKHSKIPEKRPHWKIRISAGVASFLIVFSVGHFLGQAYEYRYTTSSISTCNERSR